MTAHRQGKANALHTFMHRVIPHPPPQTLLLLFSVNGFLSSIFERFSRFFFGGGVGTPFFSTNFHRFLQLWLFVVVVFAGKKEMFSGD